MFLNVYLIKPNLNFKKEKKSYPSRPRQPTLTLRAIIHVLCHNFHYRPLCCRTPDRLNERPHHAVRTVVVLHPSATLTDQPSRSAFNPDRLFLIGSRKKADRLKWKSRSAWWFMRPYKCDIIVLWSFFLGENRDWMFPAFKTFHSMFLSQMLIS